MDKTPYHENPFAFSKIKTKRHTCTKTDNKMLPDNLRPVEQPFGLARVNKNQYELSDRQAPLDKEKGGW